MKRIQSFEELLDYSLQCYFENKIIERVQLKKGFNFTITVCGGTWDDKIDYRAAKYIIAFQDEINRIIKEYVAENTPEYNLLKKDAIIKVKVEPGSSLFTIDPENAINLILANMTSAQVFILSAVGIVGLVGYMSFNKWLQHREKILTHIEHEKTKQKLIDIFKHISEKFENFERPIRTLIQGMEEEDKIKLPGHKEPLTKFEAKRIYPRKERTRPFECNIDDNYLVTDIKLETPAAVTLEKDDISFRADIYLPDEMITDFYSLLETKHKEGKLPFSMNLQVKATVSRTNIRNAIIEGLGKPRKGAQNLLEIIE
jgi:hypothetical protein